MQQIGTLQLSVNDVRKPQEPSEDWARHVESILRVQARVPRTMQVLAFLAIKNPNWAVPDASDEHLFATLVSWLAWYRFMDGIPQLLVFVYILASGADVPRSFGSVSAPTREELGRWVARGLEIMNVAPADFGKRQAAAEQRLRELLAVDPALLLAVEPLDEQPEQYQVSAWVWLAEGLCENIGSGLAAGYRFDEIPSLLPGLRRAALRYVAGRSVAMTVELFLPRRLLSQPVGLWPILVGLDGDEEVPVGREHRVMVRSSERALSPSEGAREVREKWRDKWHRLANLELDQAARVLKPESAEAFLDVGAFLQRLRDDDVVCYAETLSPPPSIDYRDTVLKRVINAGLPFGLWLRDHPSPAAIYRELEQLADGAQLRRLSELVHERCSRDAMQAKSLGSLLVLFYDDPRRLPFDPDAQRLAS